MRAILSPNGPLALEPHPEHPLVAIARPWTGEATESIFQTLMDGISWTDGGYEVAGRRFALPRLQCWFADPGVVYRYADQLQNSCVWTPPLAALRDIVEGLTGRHFNAVLANLYRNGEDRVAWHADDEDDLGPAPEIASLNFGATRRFHWRPKAGVVGEAGSVALPAGTLLLMAAPFQRDWQHAVLPETEVSGPRLNLTFRRVFPPG
jgi:alkylated DNA repair dioxygenase AlkB